MSKKQSLVLLIITLSVWLFLGYRIIKYFQTENFVVESFTKKTNAQRDAISTDTLLLNYPDPFINDQTEEEFDDTDLYLPEKISPPSLVYLGMINNRNLKKCLACIMIGNSQLIVRKNDIVNGLKIVAIYRDSITVYLDNHTYTFNQNAIK